MPPCRSCATLCGGPSPPQLERKMLAEILQGQLLLERKLDQGLQTLEASIAKASENAGAYSERVACAVLEALPILGGDVTRAMWEVPAARETISSDQLVPFLCFDRSAEQDRPGDKLCDLERAVDYETARILKLLKPTDDPDQIVTQALEVLRGHFPY